MVVIALSSQVKCTNAMMSFRKIFRMVDEVVVVVVIIHYGRPGDRGGEGDAAEAAKD